MKAKSFAEMLEHGAPARRLTEVIIHELAVFNLGKTVDFNFLSRQSVGGYCRALGFAAKRNWALLALDKIAPKSPLGPGVVPEMEAKAVLAQLRHVIDKRLMEPKMGKPQPDILADFLPKGRRYKRARTLGHLWEFRYALAVELEHGKSRGANLTNNHPLLTALVVAAHLAEDRLYYARVWEMETSGELFKIQLGKASPGTVLQENLRAKVHLQQRMQESAANA